MIAEKKSRCAAECGVKIRPGDEITDLSEGEWAHVDCPVVIEGISRPVCGECFTETSVSGKCMCGAA